jgi:hypothetical protein
MNICADASVAVTLIAATAVAMLHAQLRAAIFTLRLLTVDSRS